MQNSKKDAARRDAHFSVLRTIEAHPDYSQRQIAEALGVSLGSVNYCLKSLIEVGFVKVKNFRSSENKLRYAYFLTPTGAAEKAALTGTFLRKKMREYEALKAEIDALERESKSAQSHSGAPEI